MRYDHPELRERLAVGYALASLHGEARERLEGLIRDDPAVAAAVACWQVRLNGQAGDAPVNAPAESWAHILKQAGHASAQPAATVPPAPVRMEKLWNNIALWRAIGIGATAVATALIIFLAVRRPDTVSDRTPVVVLNDEYGHPAFVAIAAYRARRLALAEVSVRRPLPGKAYQIWLLPKSGTPRSLGLVPQQKRVSIDLSAKDAGALTSAEGIAISLEPAGGSPTGLPSGPILFKGPPIVQP
jgi:anti-sigma-K factor RskA